LYFNREPPLRQTQGGACVRSDGNMHDCKKIKQEYETLQKQAGDFLLQVNEIRAAEKAGKPLDREKFTQAKQAMKRLTAARIAFREKLVYSVETIQKILGEKNIRGPVWPKSADNLHDTKDPDPDYQVSEVERTRPEQAVKMLEGMYSATAGWPGLDTKKWKAALERGVTPAIRACRELGIDPKRLIVFPWIKRSALAKFCGANVTKSPSPSPGSEHVHYGALLEAGVFPKLEEVYAEKGLDFINYRAGAMSSDNYLQMEPSVAKWLTQREEEVDGDICFSAVLLDTFHGYSVDATRHETDKEKRLVDGTSYLVQQMLLTQSQLQTKWEELHWWMSGDKYDSTGQHRFPSALYSRVHAYACWFGGDFAGDAHSSYGSVVLPSEVL